MLLAFSIIAIDSSEVVEIDRMIVWNVTHRHLRPPLMYSRWCSSSARIVFLGSWLTKVSVAANDVPGIGKIGVYLGHLQDVP